MKRLIRKDEYVTMLDKSKVYHAVVDTDAECDTEPHMLFTEYYFKGLLMFDKRAGMWYVLHDDLSYEGDECHEDLRIKHHKPYSWSIAIDESVARYYLKIDDPDLKSINDLF